MPPNQNIRDIQDGQKVVGVFLVKSMTCAETKAGKPYLSLTLMDASGEIEARVWENAEQLKDECPPGAVVQVSGLAQSYRGVLQLKLDTVSRLAGDEADPSRFLPTTRANVKQMAKELLELAQSVQDPYLRELLLLFLKDRRFMGRFKQAVAAKSMHHGYLGGLLEHTLGVTRLADKIAHLYPAVDRDLLIAGAVLHDIGKVREFDLERIPHDYSDEGRLVGHMVLGVEMIQERAREIPGFPADLAARIKHLVISHHGRHEFGTPVVPMILEGFLLHLLDDLDAKVNYFERLSQGLEGESYQWSEYQRTLERFLYLRPMGPELNSRDDRPDNPNHSEVDPRQRRLFE